MNKRIRELAEQAGFIGESMNPIFGTCQETALKNFAKLLIERCADIAHYLAPSDESAEEIRYGIKEHFGVK